MARTPIEHLLGSLATAKIIRPMTVLIALVAALIGGGIGFDIGWGRGYSHRSAELASNSHTYDSVQVIKRFDAFNYRVQPAGMKKYNWTLCPGSHIDWQEGWVLPTVTYEQRDGCKLIAGPGGYERNDDAYGKPIIFKQEADNAK
jgi:hypothetical protein